MKTVINYKIDVQVLENAVRNCICNGLPPNLKNVKATIQKVVLGNGLSAIQFPEHWYTTDEEIKFYPQDKINQIVNKLHGRIN